MTTFNLSPARAAYLLDGPAWPLPKVPTRPVLECGGRAKPWQCSRPRGHAGRHCASVEGGYVVAVWS